MKSILEDYREQRRRLSEAYIMPTRITFSAEGYLKAKAMTDAYSLMDNFLTGVPQTFDGLPFNVVRDQHEDIKVHNAMTDVRARGSIAVRLSADLSDARKTVADIIGGNMSEDQISDIVMGFVEANPRSQLAAALKEAVRLHGRFE